ncbi:putative ABC transport system permease protein [Pseudoduganella lurida]|uniref:Putative ABC transport system permease protein n=1 Tax=Pseudoduganella lurida TaxID=1036180 RepID=A0A562QZD8_9BURK|nr:FtsX-like permease family protein [Pseudoduganella lurida]TWI62179.1 putative ABC transport system permease protein [Pseudoduganella lurida]
MMTWLNLAVRNLFRNGRRSGFTVLAIGLGFLAVNVLGGFTNYMFTSLQHGYIYGEANGHLTVFRRGFLDRGKLDPTRFLLDAAAVQGIRTVLRQHPEVLLATPQLQISGLLSNGQVSTIFLASGRVPSDVAAIAALGSAGADRVRRFDGAPLSDARSFGIGVSHGLARQLDLALGATAVAMAPTVSGQINALDAQLVQLIDAPVEALDDKLATVPLAFAQALYDTASVDRVTVVLAPGSDPATVRAALAREMAHAGLAVEVRTWEELSPFYTKVKKMFDVIFLISFLIVFTIVVMSVVNTFTMAVLERTREIGTLRAIGMRRRGIVGLFALESAVLAGFGTLLGAALTLGVVELTAWLQPTWIPPQMARRVPLQIHFVPLYWLASCALLAVLSVGSAVLPARRAARMPITGAMGFA